jgi:hypothetical protein
MHKANHLHTRRGIKIIELLPMSSKRKTRSRSVKTKNSNNHDVAVDDGGIPLPQAQSNPCLNEKQNENHEQNSPQNLQSQLVAGLQAMNLSPETKHQVKSQATRSAPQLEAQQQKSHVTRKPQYSTSITPNATALPFLPYNQFLMNSQIKFKSQIPSGYQAGLQDFNLKANYHQANYQTSTPGPWHRRPANPPSQLVKPSDVNSRAILDVVNDGRGRRQKSPKIALPAPSSSPTYLKKAEEVMKVDRSVPRRLLVVLDLNGTLLYRTNSKSTFRKRDRVESFLQYIMKRHDIMVWSSSTPHNANRMVGRLFSMEHQAMLLAIWARDTLRLSAENYQLNVQVYKQLSWLWESEVATSGPGGLVYDQTNTVLIDDSALKASSEPYNLVEIPEFKGEDEAADILGQVAGYLSWLAIHQNVSSAIKSRPFKADGTWKWKWKEDDISAQVP